MAITLGVHASAGSDDGTTAVTPARNVTSGSCLVACVSWGTDATPATLSDSAGNTWTRIGSVLGPLAGNYPEAGAIYKCENCVGGANYVLTAARSGEYPSVAYQEFLGDGVAVEAIASGPVDTATPYVSTAVTPAANGAGLFSGFVYNGVTGTNTAASPLATVEEVNNASLYYPLAIGAAVQATAAAVAASWTTTAAPGGGAVWTVALHEAGSTPVAYTLPADAGSYALTGVAAALAYIAARKLAADTGAFGLTGSDATLHYAAARRLAADAGLFAVAGIAASLRYSGAMAPAPTLGDNAIVWSRNGMGTNPQSAGPMVTQTGSKLVVVLACGPEVATQVPTDNYGNTFVQRGSRVEYDLYPGYGTNVFIAENIVGGSGHVVSVDTTAAPFNEFTMHVAEVRGAAKVAGVDFVETSLPAAPISPPVTTTAPALMLAYWWGSDGSGVDTITAGDGFTTFAEKATGTTIGGYIQGASAHRATAAAGTYTVEWTASPAQGAILGLLSFEGDGNVLGAGTFTLTGAPAGLFLGRRMQADAGVLALTGSDATLAYAPATNYALASDAGSFTASGAAAALLVGRAMPAESGAYATTGAAAGFRTARVLPADGGAVTLTGAPAALLYVQAGAYAMAANAGTFACTGADVALVYQSAPSYTLATEAGAFALAGAQMGFLRDRRLPADTGALVFIGSGAVLLYSGEIIVQSPAVTIRIQPVVTRVRIPARATRILIPESSP